MRKAIVFVVLGIPVLIAIILKFFGQNQFEIPVYYQDGITSEECGIQSSDQYVIQEFETINGDQHHLRGGISIIYFHSELNENSARMTRELERIFSAKSKSKLLKVYALTDEETVSEMISGSTLLRFDREQLGSIAICNLLLPQSDSAGENIDYSIIVLVDSTGRIRGYYNGTEEEEYDRLSAEVDILFLEDSRE
jgi:protein SCO1/2